MIARKEGVLVIAHGSPNPEWNRLVEEAVEQVQVGLPISVGYLESLAGQGIADGVQRLEKEGVERIRVIPLFVSSGSTHLEEIRYALGVIDHSRVKTDLRRIQPWAQILWDQAMDAHPLIQRILEDRVGSLAESPREENLLLVAHGSEKPGFREEWEKGLEALAEGLRVSFGFATVEYAMLRVGDMRSKAERLSREKRLLVLPVFLSQGYFTDVILRQELEGIPCAYRGETYLPHPLVSRWIEETLGQMVS